MKLTTMVLLAPSLQFFQRNAYHLVLFAYKFTGKKIRMKAIRGHVFFGVAFPIAWYQNVHTYRRIRNFARGMACLVDPASIQPNNGI